MNEILKSDMLLNRSKLIVESRALQLQKRAKRDGLVRGCGGNTPPLYQPMNEDYNQQWTYNVSAWARAYLQLIRYLTHEAIAVEHDIPAVSVLGIALNPRNSDTFWILPTNITPSLVFSAADATPSLVFSAATAMPSFALDSPFINTSILAQLLWRHVLDLWWALTIHPRWSPWRLCESIDSSDY